MPEKIPTDAEVYERHMREPGTRRGIEALAWEIRQGDATGRQRAVNDLRNLGLLAREVAAVKRHLKST